MNACPSSLPPCDLLEDLVAPYMPALSMSCRVVKHAVWRDTLQSIMLSLMLLAATWSLHSNWTLSRKWLGIAKPAQIGSAGQHSSRLPSTFSGHSSDWLPVDSTSTDPQTSLADSFDYTVLPEIQQLVS